MEGELRTEGVSPAVLSLLMPRFTRVTHAADLWRQQCKELEAQKPLALEPEGLEQLREKVTRLESANAIQTDALTLAIQTQDTYRSEKEVAEAKIVTLQNQLAATNLHASKVEGENSGLYEEIAEHEDQANTARAEKDALIEAAGFLRLDVKCAQAEREALAKKVKDWQKLAGTMTKRLEEAQKSCDAMKEERDAAVAENGNLHEVVDVLQHGVDNRKEENKKEAKQWEEERKDYKAQWKEWLDEKEKLKEELQRTLAEKKNLDMSYKCLKDDRDEMTRTLQLRAVERNKAEEAEARALATAHEATESLNQVLQQQVEMQRTIREQGECNDWLQVEWDNERNRWELIRRDLQRQLNSAIEKNNKAKTANDERKRTINELQEQRREILKEMGQLAQNHREVRENYQESKEETQALQVQLQRAVHQRDALKRKGKIVFIRSKPRGRCTITTHCAIHVIAS